MRGSAIVLGGYFEAFVREVAIEGERTSDPFRSHLLEARSIDERRSATQAGEVRDDRSLVQAGSTNRNSHTAGDDG